MRVAAVDVVAGVGHIRQTLFVGVAVGAAPTRPKRNPWGLFCYGLVTQKCHGPAAPLRDSGTHTVGHVTLSGSHSHEQVSRDVAGSICAECLAGGRLG